MQHLTPGTKRFRTLLAVLVIGLAASTAQAGEKTNSIGITMVDIPAGSFTMGVCHQDKKSAFLGESNCANPDTEAKSNETPHHRVNIRAFQMSKTEVTLGQFKRFIKAAGRSDLADDFFIDWNDKGDNAPVVTISWDAAQAFIDWLNSQDGGGYRLPSEAEWEYACRARGQHKYCGGNNLGELGWYFDNRDGGQQPVARKKPNAFGLYDMSGNVWEWVQDCWHDNYRGAPDDGSAWTSSCSGDERVQRGGSWAIDSTSSRAANRNSSAPHRRQGTGMNSLVYSYGFRLARTR